VSRPRFGRSLVDVRLEGSRLTTYDANGFLGIQFDGYGEQESGLVDVEVFRPLGVFGRPPAATLDANGTATFTSWALSLWDGDDLTGGLILNDPRVQTKLPEISEEGGAGLHGFDGAWCLFDSEKHTFTLYQPIEFDGDGVPTKAHVVTIGIDGNGTPIVELVHANGQAITMLGDAFVLSSKDGGARFELAAGGAITAVGNMQVTGGIAAGALPVPLLKAAPAVSHLTTLQAALTAVQAALAALAAIPVNGAASAAIAAAGVAVGVAQGSLAGLGTTGPTTQTSGT
jgi:hypothetical protein